MHGSAVAGRLPSSPDAAPPSQTAGWVLASESRPSQPWALYAAHLPASEQVAPTAAAWGWSRVPVPGSDADSYPAAVRERLQQLEATILQVRLQWWQASECRAHSRSVDVQLGIAGGRWWHASSAQRPNRSSAPPGRWLPPRRPTMSTLKLRCCTGTNWDRDSACRDAAHNGGLRACCIHAFAQGMRCRHLVHAPTISRIHAPAVNRILQQGGARPAAHHHHAARRAAQRVQRAALHALCLPGVARGACAHGMLGL